MEKETKQEKKNNEQAAIEREKAERKRIKKSIYITIFINVAVSLLITALGLLWQKSLTILAWSNAMLLTLIMIFFIGWIMFIYNKNIISIFTHGFKVFGLMIVGKRPKKSYYEVKVQVEENQIPKRYMAVSFIYSAILLVITIILTILAL